MALANVDLDAPVLRLIDIVGGRHQGSRSPRPTASSLSTATPDSINKSRIPSARVSDKLSLSSAFPTRSVCPMTITSDAGRSAISLRMLARAACDS
jgi:hypothetical protein